MDNNNPAATNTPNTPSVQPQAVNSGTPAPSNQTKSNKMIWLVGGIIIVLVIGALYLYFNNQQKTSQNQPKTQGGIESSESVATLEKELNSVTAEEGDDLSALDTDLQNL